MIKPKRTPQLSLRAFSRQLGLSPSTVSRSFGRPEVVAAETRQRVLQMAQQVGFRPSPVTRAAVGKSTRSIGVLLPPLSVSFFADVAMGLQRVLLEKDYLPMIVIDAGPSALRGVERLIDHRVDALIFGLSDEAISQEQLRAVTGPDFPLVLVDQPHPGLDYDCAVNDDEGGGYQAGRHLVELGHRRFGIFHYGEGTTNCEARIKGFQRAVEEAGGRIRPEDVVDNPPHLSPEARRQCRLEGLERILRGSDRPTAFFATTDLFARSVMQVACRLGLRIPADLSVAGFADLNFSELLDPPLTTVRQNGEALGEQAGELVLARLQDPSRESRRVTISTQLIVRGSTGPLISGESGHIA